MFRHNSNDLSFDLFQILTPNHVNLISYIWLVTVTISNGKNLESDWEYQGTHAKESASRGRVTLKHGWLLSAQNGCLLEQEQEISLVHGGQCSKLDKSVDFLKQLTRYQLTRS